ncbi:MAG: putative Ig domain-containing protein [Thermoguttaceae bacterium]
MDFSSFRKTFSRKQRRERAHRRAQQEYRRQRVFEALEDRKMLDAASFYETLPPAITIAETDQSYHYALEGSSLEMVDGSSLSDLVASLPKGEQVSFTVMKTATDGAVSTIGDVVVQLFSATDEAPNSSTHFLDLVADEYYEGLSIHRIIKDFMFQGGSPTGDGIGGSGLEIDDEYSDLLTHSRRGTLAYANSGPGTSDAQFYITFAAAGYLDNNYNVFGYVVDGYDVLDELEAAKVKKNPVSGEESSPVDSYTLTNVHVVDESDVDSGVLRLVVGDDAEGVTELSISSINEEGATELQKTTVYVGNDGLEAYLKDALKEYDFNITAGDSISVSLPSSFGDYDVNYTITVDEDASRYDLTTKDDSNSNFTLTTEKAGAQALKLTIDANISEKVFVGSVRASDFDESDYGDNYEFSYYSNGPIEMVAIHKIVSLSASTTQDVFISPVAPDVTVEADEQATVDDVVYIGSSFLDDEVQITIDAYRVDSTLLLGDELIVELDGTQYSYNRVSHTYDEETGLDRYVITLNLDEELSEGLHTLTVQDSVRIGGDRDPLLSDVTSFEFFYDPTAVEFVDVEESLPAYIGTSDSYQFTTNKTTEDGTQRGDVTFSFVDADSIPSFLTLSKTGFLGWKTLTEGDAGAYTFEVQATDALGRVATTTMTLNVVGSLAFSDFVDTSAKTGAEYLGQVSAFDAADENAIIKYSLINESNLMIDEDTGVLNWTIPNDYLGSGVKTQTYSFTVKATEFIEQEDGTLIEGDSIEQTFTIEVANMEYEEDADMLPTWNELPDQKFTAGEEFTLETVETPPTGVEDVEYFFISDVPEGMTISADGVISWNPDADYFDSTKIHSTSFEIELGARSLVSSTDTTADYTDTTTTSFTLTLLNPKYKDLPPVIEDITDTDAVTGETYTITIIADDPNNHADAMFYELLGDSLPPGLSIGSRTGVLTWEIDADYLDPSVRYQSYVITVKVTELYHEEGEEDNVFTEGLSTTKSFAIYIDNALYDEDEAIVPVWDEIDDQTVTAGDDFSLTVEAKADSAVEIVYALSGEYPDGMTIDSDGLIRWEVPEDFFADTTAESRTITINLVSSAIIGQSDVSDDFSGSAKTSFKITVLNPNYEDAPPAFSDIKLPPATTDSTYKVNFVAKDPNKLADRIVYSIVGDRPDGMVLNAITGGLTWEIPADLIAKNITSKTFNITIKATEQFLGEDGKTYTNGLSSTKTYGINVKNGRYEEDSAVAPKWVKPPAQSVTAGETLETSVHATVPSSAEGVSYSLGDDAPEGMKIDPTTGKITWKVPKNYFKPSDTTTQSKKITVKLVATAVISSSDSEISYGESATTTLEIRIDNPYYIDPAPVLEDLDESITYTGETFETTIKATDPTGDADRIIFDIDLEKLPKGMTFDAETGKLTWKIPDNYLKDNVSVQVFYLPVIATKQNLNEDGEYEDGLTSTRVYEIMVVNSTADPDELDVPIVSEIEDQTVEAGDTLEFTVSGKLPEDATATDVRYSFASDADVPEGMTIDPETGVVTYKVPSDYFDKLDKDSDVLKIKIQVQAVVSSTDSAINYGGSTEIEVTITVTKPKGASEYDSWHEWFDDWLQTTQERYDAHATNLSTYLASYLAAVEARNEGLQDAVDSYRAGKTTLSELIKARKDVHRTFEDATAKARETLAEADAKVEAEYQKKLGDLTSAFNELKKEGKAPSDADAQKADGAKDVVKSSVDRSTGGSKFRLTNKTTGASVATNLTNVLKIWRSGYSKSSIYNDIYSDPGFVDSIT